MRQRLSSFFFPLFVPIFQEPLVRDHFYSAFCQASADYFSGKLMVNLHPSFLDELFFDIFLELLDRLSNNAFFKNSFVYLSESCSVEAHLIQLFPYPVKLAPFVLVLYIFLLNK